MVELPCLPSARTLIGLDLGGTKTAVARFKADTWELQEYERPSTDTTRGFEGVFEDSIALIEKLRTKDTVAIGIGIPGLLRQPEGHLIHAPNIPGGTDIALKKMFGARFDLPVFVENDVRCFTLAEATLGAGKGRRVVVGLTLGTGVGGGIVIDGRIFHGEHGYAGEIGHMLLKPGEPPYKTKDMRGEVEQFISGTAMGKRCEEAKSPEDYLKDGGTCSFMQPSLFKEVAWTIASITYLVDPSIIVIGGSAGRALKPHLAAVKKELRQWLLPHTPMPELTIAKLEHPGSLGAALLTVSKQSV
jgi:glucokinase